MSDELKDVRGTEFSTGAHVGVAFSYSRASVGYLRLGVVQEIGYDTYDGVVVKVLWDADGKVSPWIKYGDKKRWVLLS